MFSVVTSSEGVVWKQENGSGRWLPIGRKVQKTQPQSSSIADVNRRIAEQRRQAEIRANRLAASQTYAERHAAAQRIAAQQRQQLQSSQQQQAGPGVQYESAHRRPWKWIWEK